MTIKALIFDFDGVITDTEPIHMNAWLSALESFGISFSENDYKNFYIGLNDRDFLYEIGRRNSVSFDDAQKTELIKIKAAICMERLKSEIPLIPGVREFIEESSKKYMLAICSGALRSEIGFILKKSGLFDYFCTIISAESVEKGKPDPEGYIKTLEDLRVLFSSVILANEVAAIEDSPKGIEAARKAGLKCIGVTNSYPRAELTFANLVVDSLAELDSVSFDLK
ncbi:MAG TPA: HAD family phosphatase [bacterium]|nr:HAD family phosphatase [Myxococcales bacterium]HQG13427.1 HAD family phosphatase [bacterium]